MHGIVDNKEVFSFIAASVPLLPLVGVVFVDVVFVNFDDISGEFLFSLTLTIEFTFDEKRFSIFVA